MANIAVRDANGTIVYMQATGSGTDVDPFVVTHAMTVDSLPLPAGAATSAAQATAQTALDAIAANADGALTKLSSIEGRTPALVGGEVPGADAQLRAAIGTQADAEATGNGSVVGVLKRVRTLLGNIYNALTGTLTVGGTVAVSNLPATQPVSGTVAVSNQPTPGTRGDEFVGDIATNRPTLGVDQVAVAIPHPDYPTTIDPQSTVPVGGTTADGFTVRMRTDKAGGQLLSDAPVTFTGQANSLAAPVIVAFETIGYQSISLQLTGTWAGTVTFYVSNNGADWQLAAGYPASSSAAMQQTAAANNLFSFPAVGRFFKAQLTAYTSGTVAAIALLRAQPMAAIVGTRAVSINQVDGVTAVTGGVSGIMAIGGNVAPSAAPTAFPVPMGGWDGALTRRLLTNTAGALGVYGAATLPVAVSEPATRYTTEIAEPLLWLILRELRIANKLSALSDDRLNEADDQLRDDQSFWPN